MNYSKAIRTARALADMPQRELAEKVGIDASLISMLESGKRKPSLDTLERIAQALDIPFHLFTLLAAEREDIKSTDPDMLHKLAVGLSKLLLTGDEDDPDVSGSSEAQHSQRKTPRRPAARPQRKAS